VDIQLRRLSTTLADRGLELCLTDWARACLAEDGYDPGNGTRPLKRAIQQYLQDPLALALLQGQFQWGDRIVAKLEGDRIVFVPEAGSEAGAG